jgi:WD40 repeat protein
MITEKFKIPQNCVCAICQSIPLEGETCQACQVLYCSDCINPQLIISENKCLECHNEYVRGPIPESMGVSLSGVMLPCIYRDYGCTQTLSYNDLLSHRSTCEFRPTACSICQQFFRFADLGEHTKLCSNDEEISCNNCGFIAKRKDFKHSCYLLKFITFYLKKYFQENIRGLGEEVINEKIGAIQENLNLELSRIENKIVENTLQPQLVQQQEYMPQMNIPREFEERISWLEKCLDQKDVEQQNLLQKVENFISDAMQKKEEKEVLKETNLIQNPELEQKVSFLETILNKKDNDYNFLEQKLQNFMASIKREKERETKLLESKLESNYSSHINSLSDLVNEKLKNISEKLVNLESIQIQPNEENLKENLEVKIAQLEDKNKSLLAKMEEKINKQDTKHNNNFPDLTEIKLMINKQLKENSEKIYSEISNKFSFLSSEFARLERESRTRCEENYINCSILDTDKINNLIKDQISKLKEGLESDLKVIKKRTEEQLENLYKKEHSNLKKQLERVSTLPKKDENYNQAICNSSTEINLLRQEITEEIKENSDEIMNKLFIFGENIKQINEMVVPWVENIEKSFEKYKMEIRTEHLIDDDFIKNRIRDEIELRFDTLKSKMEELNEEIIFLNSENAYHKIDIKNLKESSNKLEELLENLKPIFNMEKEYKLLKEEVNLQKLLINKNKDEFNELLKITKSEQVEEIKNHNNLIKDLNDIKQNISMFEQTAWKEEFEHLKILLENRLTEGMKFIEGGVSDKLKIFYKLDENLTQLSQRMKKFESNENYSQIHKEVTSLIEKINNMNDDMKGLKKMNSANNEYFQTFGKQKVELSPEAKNPITFRKSITNQIQSPGATKSPVKLDVNLIKSNEKIPESYQQDIKNEMFSKKVEKKSVSKELQKSDILISPGLTNFITDMKSEVLVQTNSQIFSILHLKNYDTGLYFLSGHKDGSICVWESNNFSLVKTYSEHKNFVDDMKELSSSIQDSLGLFASCSKDTTIKIWNIEHNESIMTINNDCWTYCLSFLKNFNNNYIASGDDKKIIKIWNFKTGMQEMVIESGHKSGVGRILHISSLQPYNLLLSSSNPDIKLWDLEDGSCLRTYSEHSDWVNGLCYIGNGMFCSTSADKLIKIWNFDVSSSLKTISVHKSYVSSVLYLKDLIDEDIILSGSLGKTSKLIDLKTESVLASFEREHAIFKMEPIYRHNENIKIVGCYWGSNALSIWGKKKEQL